MLQLTNIKKSYREPGGNPLPVLDIPSFRVESAEQIALVGRSGGGKTTLLHIIAGITRADSGSIVLDGLELSQLSEPGLDKVRAQKIGYVFQTFNLLSGFSALENVLLGMTFGKGKYDSDRARQLLAKVGLSHRLGHKPRQLSVGEQQRVAVARALACKPSLLLADEPTANIDPRNQQHIIDLIRESCRDEGVSLVIVTHSSEVAGQFTRIERLEQINRAIADVVATTK
ncbi:ABC transporter related protein [Pirellula staleyi DSM 6068]|uniref:ABC transporter related protein n=1 Tax=Pirellula staleyi (strain ATCC 27377 / DSM 6068 / ICPB 4128) TaxID=530564 RepID=D2R3D2_PIRSD|nr:ABC transporter ATP-binding protein [Pirellula staleyi]ADB15163.1 ABC transporter related protein [Pirellula staleyi DSM 6068]